MTPVAILLAAILFAGSAAAQEPPSQPIATMESDSPGAQVPQPDAADPGWPDAVFAGLQEQFAASQGHGGTGAHDLSAIGMFIAADIVVKAIMIILALLSVLTWGVWLSRLAALARGRRQLRMAYRALDEAGSLPEAMADTQTSGNPLYRMIAAAIRERERSAAPGFPVEGIKARAAAHLGRIEAAAARRMQAGSGILASMASSAPFIGLFGTVWGIMNSFIGIAGSGTTNLAVVAPGIAEALLATALGLAAAIPATLFHNHIARGIGGYRLMLADAAELATRTLSRDLDRPGEAAEIETAGQRKAA